jgi:uncharacterized protein (DUF2147 family)
MKAALVLAAGALLAAPDATAQTGGSPGVDGEWWTPGFAARVRIESCGDAVCGRIVWLWDEAPKGPADKTPLTGRLVIDRMHAAEAGVWRGGRLHNPEDGRDYQGSLRLQTPDRLVIDGCVLFLCQTQVWRRADPRRCPPVAALARP